MRQLLDVLCERAERDVRLSALRRYDAMCRDLRYRYEKGDERLGLCRGRGWSEKKFNALFALNSFWQIVLAPLASAARNRPECGLGTDVPVVYGGTLRLNKARGRELNAAYSDFMRMAETLGFSERLLSAVDAEDVVFRLSQELKQQDNDES